MKKIIIILVGIMLIGLFGCGQQKYKLELDGYGLSSKKTSYAEGATVKVTFDLIATDTDYYFSLDCEDTTLHYEYDKGVYVMTFKMPAHDVKLSVSSKNTMEYIPDVVITLDNQVGTADIWITEDTPDNRKQSTWSGTTIKACEVNAPQEISLAEVSGDALYIIRMIDENKLYYEACSVEILDGYSVVIKAKEDNTGTAVYVYDDAVTPVNEYEMFSAAL